MLVNLKRTFLIIIVLGSVYCCNTRNLSSTEKSGKVKAEITKKQKAKREKQKDAAIKKHYDRQAESTRESMEQNKLQSEKWRKDYYHNKSGFYHFRKFLELFKREPKPERGLFTKKQVKGRKKCFLKRMFTK
ncbi:MAG: hypothetical protein A2X13_09905 [Bacteroidetes bacterium GWC2_33_15]|nr:MAG: hypothetical protein A2X10_10470 [Bacteroidetes bacterium GWA2_33_15]OFX49013.1 MAG: hypothetical protein A2X13_09905 [Bacteroidetes bacterium GWC2_33_15]OFX64723.1 MAG: hypothetical protein A2X15_05310 [Bacteroidetes bacterium GWB2_32_14]OFX68425.1 MAG: hypothetical protein A2X14_14865 [Bacteroidetes bacterium GWD2_33_33]HAN19147.1 hypothetical protein [Bacteroidales bacterium]